MKKLILIFSIALFSNIQAQTWKTEDQYIQRFAQYAVEDTRIEPSFGMYGWGRPFGWGVGMSRAWTYDYNRGSLIIDIVDAKTGKLVWQGVGSGINVDSPKSKQKQIPAIVAEIMANYPPVKK